MFKRELNAKLVLSVIATGIMSFSGVVVETAMNVTFPTLMEEFSIGTSTVQWMTTSYLLILAIIMPMSSFLNRRFKTKSIFTVAMIFYISGILCGFAAPTFMLLLLGRILEGIGTGLALPLMFNIITEQAPLKNMGVMMGIGMLVTAVAPAVGPSAGGWIAEHLGWRMIFAGLLPFLIVAFILGISSIQQSHETEVISFDVFGWLLLTVSFIALIFVIDESSAFGLLSIPVLLAIVIFVGSLTLFVHHENSFKHQELSDKSPKIPIINLDVFSEKGFVLSLFAIVALQFIILGQSYLLPNFSQLVLGAGATAAGAQMLPGCAIGAIMAPISGQILDKLGAKKPIVTGILCCLTSMLLLLLFVHVLTVEMITYIFAIFAIGQALQMGNNFTVALGYLPEDRKADGNAVINTMQQLFGAMGTSVISGVVAASQLGATDLATSTLAGAQNALLVLVCVACIPLVTMGIVLFVLPKITK